jgi:hypothetical protein
LTVHTQLVVKRSIQVEYRVPLSAYGGMSAEEAAEYERSLPRGEAQENIVLVLEDTHRAILSCSVMIEQAPLPHLLTQVVELSGPNQTGSKARVDHPDPRPA